MYLRLLGLFFLLFVSQAVELFPRIVWVFWDTKISSAPTITKLCALNIQRYAALSGWELRMLHTQTIDRWLKEPERFYRTIAQAKIKMEVQHKADLLRLTLIKDYGGMWVDINSFFLEDFSWLDNLKD